MLRYKLIQYKILTSKAQKCIFERRWRTQALGRERRRAYQSRGEVIWGRRKPQSLGPCGKNANIEVRGEKDVLAHEITNVGVQLERRNYLRGCVEIFGIYITRLLGPNHHPKCRPAQSKMSCFIFKIIFLYNYYSQYN